MPHTFARHAQEGECKERERKTREGREAAAAAASFAIEQQKKRSMN